MAVRLQAKVRECGLSLWPSLYAGSVCSTRLVEQYKCYVFAFDSLLLKVIISELQYQTE